MSGRTNRPNLFDGFWRNLDGTKIRRIYRDEWPEVWRLYRLCSEQEASALGQGFRRWLPAEGGYAEISFPGVPRFVERWQEEPTKAPNPCAAAVASSPVGRTDEQQTALPASASEAA